MFLLYHSDGCNTSETVFHWCYVNDLHTTHAVVCWVTADICRVNPRHYHTLIYIGLIFKLLFFPYFVTNNYSPILLWLTHLPNFGLVKCGWAPNTPLMLRMVWKSGSARISGMTPLSENNTNSKQYCSSQEWHNHYGDGSISTKCDTQTRFSQTLAYGMKCSSREVGNYPNWHKGMTTSSEIYMRKKNSQCITLAKQLFSMDDCQKWRSLSKYKWLSHCTFVKVILTG
jgi:hypothetical protein